MHGIVNQEISAVLAGGDAFARKNAAGHPVGHFHNREHAASEAQFIGPTKAGKDVNDADVLQDTACGTRPEEQWQLCRTRDRSMQRRPVRLQICMVGDDRHFTQVRRRGRGEAWYRTLRKAFP